MRDASRAAKAFSLEGQLAIVTGGGTGLGYAMSSCLLACGARVVITGRRADVLKHAVAELGEGAAAEPHDVTDVESVNGLVERIEAKFGNPTILINNAGTHVKKPLEQHTREEFDRILATHVGGAFNLTQAVVLRMKAAGGGSVLFIASMSSLIGMPNIARTSGSTALERGLTSHSCFP